ncbi:MAG: response regulator transcription factor [Sphaerochaetaceae bacterium]|jgi:DNA-binding NarL/FixJ family response regulator|nr:response regulator transcription factor [Sphaerochaetaceae bacterium]NLO61646.1 response regulator transcription factor [Spirochaetales bacterium]MDD2405873.1 response regulator transcription factor [Sphaerochaetaceae bacterium]MDD3670747.1 response regulator transcription factor [Sphaerochaetaceae bacterium]MDD4258740.1 response regulator transcription factor [Sphaerochaetaceae bacterium]
MKIVIIDDDELVIESLSIIFSSEKEIDVIGSGKNGSEAINLVKKNKIDIVLMDIQMPVMDGISATKIIKNEYPYVKVVMLTTFHDYRNLHLALQAGASGYLLKSDETAKQVLTLKSVYHGLPVISEEALKSFTETRSIQQLTQRENEILIHVANGLSNKEIADKQCVTEGTVRNTISVILEKLDLRDRTQLAIYYWQKR